MGSVVSVALAVPHTPCYDHLNYVSVAAPPAPAVVTSSAAAAPTTETKTVVRRERRVRMVVSYLGPQYTINQLVSALALCCAECGGLDLRACVVVGCHRTLSHRVRGETVVITCFGGTFFCCFPCLLFP